MLRKLDVILPTWNSMPELQNTLDSLIPALGSVLRSVIIVDKFSTDGTIYTAYNWGIDNDIPVQIILDDSTLGNARKLGLQAATTKWVCFIDSDIVLPVGWLDMVRSYRGVKVGWIYGVTKEDIPFLEKAHEWKRELRNNLPRELKKGEFERAYTNNTIYKQYNMFKRASLRCTNRGVICLGRLCYGATYD